MTCEDQSYNYFELNCLANQIAHYLREVHSVGPETLVAFCLERSAKVPAVILGILKAGGAYVPVDPIYPEARQKWILEDSKAKLLITESTLEAIEDYIEQNSTPKADLDGGANAENAAYVIFTSGSTGEPKRGRRDPPQRRPAYDRHHPVVQFF